MFRRLSFLLAIVLAVTATVHISWRLYNAETQQIRSEFQRSINQRSALLDNELIRLRAIMRYWRKFYETSSASVDQDQFRAIALDLLDSYPSLQLIGWAPLVPHERRSDYEAQFRQFNPQFSIFELQLDNYVPEEMVGIVDLSEVEQDRIFTPAGKQEQYFPLTVLEPLEGVGSLTGLDLASVNIMAVSSQVEQIRDSGSSDIFALPGMLSPFSPEREPVLVALMPTYLQPGQTTGARSALLHGFIGSVFSIEELLLSTSLSDRPTDISVILRDRTGDEGLEDLYRYGSQVQAQMRYTRPIAGVLGRKWEMVASPTADYIASRRSLLPQLNLAGGLIVIALLAMYINLLRRQTALVQKEVDLRTGELRRANSELNSLNDRLEHLSRIDSLTEVANRRCFNETLDKEWRRAFRDKRPLTLLMIDVDCFKAYNDEYGHLQGDDSLKHVASVLREQFSRGGDLVARYGGEEFAVILPNATEQAEVVAEQCRAAVAALGIPHDKSPVANHLTISVGVCSVVPESPLSPKDLVESADRALYTAKESGRNAVVCSPCP